jgi:hypothetical protein
VGVVRDAMQSAHALLWLRPDTACRRAEVVENYRKNMAAS